MYRDRVNLKWRDFERSEKSMTLKLIRKGKYFPCIFKGNFENKPSAKNKLSASGGSLVQTAITCIAEQNQTTKQNLKIKTKCEAKEILEKERSTFSGFSSVAT